MLANIDTQTHQTWSFLSWLQQNIGIIDQVIDQVIIIEIDQVTALQSRTLHCHGQINSTANRNFVAIQYRMITLDFLPVQNTQKIKDFHTGFKVQSCSFTSVINAFAWLTKSHIRPRFKGWKEKNNIR